MKLIRDLGAAGGYEIDANWLPAALPRPAEAQAVVEEDVEMTLDEAESRCDYLARDLSLRVSIQPWNAYEGYALLVERVGVYGVQRVTRTDEEVTV